VIVGKDVLDAFQKGLVHVSGGAFWSVALDLFCQAAGDETEDEAGRNAQEDFVS
jgi:hypothetical protein